MAYTERAVESWLYVNYQMRGGEVTNKMGTAVSFTEMV